MRDLLAKVMTGSMVAGAALLVAACGGGGDNTANNTANATADETLMGNDVTTVDATNAGTANLGAATDMNAGAAMTGERHDHHDDHHQHHHGHRQHHRHVIPVRVSFRKKAVRATGRPFLILLSPLGVPGRARPATETGLPAGPAAASC